MKLDSRILEGKKPLTCFDIKEAKQFLGEKGYFSDFFSKYAHISNMKEEVLQSLDEHHDEAFVATCNKWEFFLPAEWVKEPETKFVPYTLDTWEQEFKPGDVIIFRGKLGTDREGSKYKCIYAGWRQFFLNDVIILGLWGFTFKELFESYEIYRDNIWELFGRKTKEGE